MNCIEEKIASERRLNAISEVLIERFIGVALAREREIFSRIFDEAGGWKQWIIKQGLWDKVTHATSNIQAVEILSEALDHAFEQEIAKRSPGAL